MHRSPNTAIAPHTLNWRDLLEALDRVNSAMIDAHLAGEDTTELRRYHAALATEQRRCAGQASN